MFTRWYYRHGGKLLGPMAVAQAIRAAAAGELLPADPLWPEEFDPDMAFPASATIDFSKLRRQPPPVTKPAAPETGVPDWLADVEQVEELDKRPPAPPTAAVPDWVDELEDAEHFIVRVKPTPPPAPRPIPRPVVLTPVQPAVPPQPTVPPPAVPPPTAVPAKTAPVTKTTTTTKTELPPAAPKPAAADAQANETGFDAETGQVLDVEKFKRWQKQAAQAPASASSAPAGETVYEVYRRGRRNLEEWVDQPHLRPLIASAPLDDIKKDAGLQAILQAFEPHGRDMIDKLLKHLDFIVGNRRQFYASGMA